MADLINVSSELAAATEALAAAQAAEAAEIGAEVSSVKLPDGKVSLNLPAVGVGVLLGLGVVGIGFGGYKLYKYLKAKNDEKKKADGEKK